MPYDISEQVINHIVNTEQNAYIKRLREKLGTTGDFIQTIRGVGYRFNNIT